MAGGSLTRADIEAWSTEHLDNAATHWTSTAQEWEGHFTTIHNGMLRPGGTTWEGAGADAAAERSWTDLVTVRGAADALHSASEHATNGAGDVAWAKRQALNAIAEAEEDGFTVGQDFSVKDTRMPSLLSDGTDRQSKAKEHAHAIQAAVQQLVDADKQAADRIHGALSPLNGLTFPGQDDGKQDPTVQMVDNKTTASGDKDKTGKGDAPDKPAEQATGQIGPFAVPKEVEDAAKRAGLKPPAPPADDGGLGALLGNDDSLEHKPGDGRPGNGLPQIPGNVPPPLPDKAAIDRQAAKVESARQALVAAESKLNGATGDTYRLGAGNGPKLDDTTALAQSVFDARKDLTEQTRVLGEMNAASGLHGGPTVPIPPLPENADVQAFPPKPSEFERGSKALSDGSFGLIPDVAKDLHTFNNWDQASGADKLQATLDAAGLVPLPGMKLGAEGLEHVLPGVARHFDDVPMPHVDAPTPHVDAPPAGHAAVNAPPSHAPVDAPVEHHAPDPIHSPDPAPPHPADVFDPNQGSHYTSGDAHYPGGWPPSTPPETWQPGSTHPGWHYVDRGERPWTPYQEQVSGAERLPDGRIPEYVRVDPQTGRPVHFDGYDIRGGHEVFLDAKDGYSSLATDPGKPWTQGMERTIVEEIPRQLRAIPPGASLEIHVSDPAGAAAIRNIIEANDWFDVTVIYTPKAP